MTAGPPEDPPPDPPGPDDVPAALVELGRLVLDRPLEEVLRRLVVLGARVLPGTDLSVTLVEGGRVLSPASSSAAAAALDERQARTGTGPCVDAATTREVVHADLAAGGPYPELTAVARQVGVRGVTSVGMGAPPPVGGALNLYTRGVGVADEVLDRARILASYATVAVAHAHLPRPPAAPVARVHEGLRSRVVVEQAKGVLMAQLGTDAADAAARLEELARRSGAPLSAVAAGVVDRARRRDRP